jgi:Protein of unknown function (DUF4246)
VISAQGKADFHPNSWEIVLDVEHPSLFPYVRGVSRVVGEEAGLLLRSESVGSEKKRNDFWGRAYEDSGIQWLASIFDVS